jgi:hypothetical protein
MPTPTAIVRQKFDGIVSEVPARPFWKWGTERAAWAYEMARRGSKVKLRSWPELSGEAQDFANTLFGISEDIKVSETIPQSQFKAGARPSSGFTSLTRAWNLHALDTELVRDFKEFIAGQRQTQGIQRPRGRQGRTTRRCPWNHLEMIDVANGNDSNRGNLNSARRRAVELSKALRHAIVRAANRRPGILSLFTLPR